MSKNIRTNRNSDFNSLEQLDRAIKKITTEAWRSARRSAQKEIKRLKEQISVLQDKISVLTEGRPIPEVDEPAPEPLPPGKEETNLKLMNWPELPKVTKLYESIFYVTYKPTVCPAFLAEVITPTPEKSIDSSPVISSKHQYQNKTTTNSKAPTNPRQLKVELETQSNTTEEELNQNSPDLISKRTRRKAKWKIKQPNLETT